MPKRIVYTRPDGGVSVCAPSLTALRYMTGGGGRWDGYPRGFLDRQIAKQSEECGERNAHRFVMAMQFGGCTDAEAYELMRDRFCAHHGTGIELWDVDDVPQDRWFRDAWVRSHNGGPIDVSLSKARAIQFRRISDVKVAVDLNCRLRRTTKTNKVRTGGIMLRYAKGKTLPEGVAAWQSAFLFGYLGAVDQENSRRRADISLFDRQIAPDWSVLRDAIRRAADWYLQSRTMVRFAVSEAAM